MCGVEVECSKQEEWSENIAGGGQSFLRSLTPSPRFPFTTQQTIPFCSPCDKSFQHQVPEIRRRRIKMSSPTAPQIRSLYRRFLRELPVRAPAIKDPSMRSASNVHFRLTKSSPIQQRVRSYISQPIADSAQTKEKLQQAEQFIQFLQAQRMYATLIERYNPGMGMSEEERVRLSARRVGMNLPVEFGPGGEPKK